ERARGQLNHRKAGTVLDMVDLLVQLRRLQDVAAGDPKGGLLTQLNDVLSAANRIGQNRDDGAAAAGAERATAGLMLPVPPVLLRAMRRIPAVLLPMTLGWYDTASREFAEMVRIHPDGLLYLALGRTLALADRWVEADRAFLAAADAPSFVPVRQPA